MTLTFPDVLPAEVEWGLKPLTQSFKSPLTGTVQSLELPGSVWKAQLKFDSLEGPDGRKVLAFLADCGGTSGRFYLYNHGHPSPSGSAPHNQGEVNGGSQTGKTLVTDTWPNNTLIFITGDFFSVNGELKIVTADVTTNGSGQATIPFAPALRASPADATKILVTQPTAIFRLLNDDQIKSAMRKNTITNILFDCEETFF